MTSEHGAQQNPRPTLSVLGLSFTYYYITSAIVVVGAAFGLDFVERASATYGGSRPSSLVQALGVWDGQSYARIANEGYAYDPAKQSRVAFFPAYPLLAAGLAALTSMRVELALLIVSHLFLLAAFALAALFVHARYPGQDAKLSDCLLLSLGLFPTTFYFRMAYTEAMFLFLVVLSLYAMHRRWPLLWTALVIGLATATRPVGVALLAAWLLDLWERSAPSWRSFGVRCALLCPIACWGLLVYMAYQAWAFNDAFAFAKTQVHWGRAVDDPTALDRAWRLLTLAPLRDVYSARSPCYWDLPAPRHSALFSMTFANPIYFVSAVAAILVGAQARWLNAKECVLAAMLLLVPYIMQADRMCMVSQARFASVVFPMHLVFAHVLSRLPRTGLVLLVALSSLILALYSALFVSWYPSY